MMYFIALIIAIALGFLTLRLITAGRLPFYLSLFLGAAIGFGVVGQIIFYLQLLGNNFNHFLPPLFSLTLLVVLRWLNRSFKIQLTAVPKSLLVLALLAIPSWLEANFFPLGGWDAWSCWNLKAKFIYLGENNWKDMLIPELWRSNTHYPLALPTINVWFWHWTGINQSAPMYNSIILTLLTAGILLLGLQELKVSPWISALVTLTVFTLAFGNILSISQYSDILFSLYLLSTFVCYLLFQNNKDGCLLILMAIFIGLLSFTKTEGLVAAVILALLMLIGLLSFPNVFIGNLGIAKTRSPTKAFGDDNSIWIFIITLLVTALPTIIFFFAMSPHNAAFINGLTSIDKPSTLARLQYVLGFTFFELLRPQWNGLWILAILGLIVGRQKSFRKPLGFIGIFVVLYLAAVLSYYQINTFFEISWWMRYTLNRIIFVLMPSIFLWMGLSLFRKDA